MEAGCCEAHISLWTEDGAANNIKSSKLLGALYEVALGMTGKHITN